MPVGIKVEPDKKDDDKGMFVGYYNGDNYYTKNAALKHTLRVRSAMSKVIGWVSGALSFLVLAFIIMLCVQTKDSGHEFVLNQAMLPYFITVGVSCLTLIVIDIIFGVIYTQMDIYDSFRETEEYKVQEAKYIEQYKLAEQRRKQAKAEKLVNAYDILDDKGMSKEERIELIQDYIEGDRR